MIFKTTYQKIAALVTTVFTVIVLLLMFFLGLRYMDPPEEYGVAINFGTSDFGSGDPVNNESIESTPEESQSSEVQEELDESVKLDEELATQVTDEAPVIENSKEVEEVVTEVVDKKLDPKETPKKEALEPAPNKETQNALNSLFGKKSTGKAGQSEGDDKEGDGVKGTKSGDPNSEKYYGNDGLGGDTNYMLKGRRALSKPIKRPNCNEEGVVVVRIEVNTNGKVIRATPGVKGTTNNSPCLLAPAKKAALSTKWNPDGNAPSKQVGLIRYEFILSE